MRLLLFCLLATVPFCIVQASGDAASSPSSTKQKLKIVIHDTPRCIVTRSNIEGGRPKFELVYVEGNVEHHIFVANRQAAQTFFKRPEMYMERLRQMERKK